MTQIVVLVLAALSLAQSALGLTRLEFHLAGRDIPDSDECCVPGVYPSDAYAILHYAPSNMDDFAEFGRTRVISDNDNPNWPETFSFNIPDNSTARFGVEVMDSDIDADDFLGYAEFTVNDILNSFGHVFAQYLNAPKGTPYIMVTALVNGTRIYVPESKPAGPAPVKHEVYIKPIYQRLTE